MKEFLSIIKKNFYAYAQATSRTMCVISRRLSTASLNSLTLVSSPTMLKASMEGLEHQTTSDAFYSTIFWFFCIHARVCWLSRNCLLINFNKEQQELSKRRMGTAIGTRQ